MNEKRKEFNHTPEIFPAGVENNDAMGWVWLQLHECEELKQEPMEESSIFTSFVSEPILFFVSIVDAEKRIQSIK